MAITVLPGNIDEAKTYLERARRIYSKVAPNSLFSAPVFLGLASVAESRNDLQQAEELGKEAWKLIRQHSSALSGDESRQRFGSARASVFATRLVRWQILLKRYRAAMVTIEESRAQALLQLLSERRAMLESTAGSLWATHRLALERQHKAEDVMRKSSTAHANVLDELTEARKNGASSEVLAQINTRVQSKAIELQQAQAQYVAASNETSRNWEKVKEQAGLSTTSVDLESGLKSLPADAVFVSFAVAEANTYIFVWRGKDSSSPAPIVKEVPVGEDQLRKLVLDFKRKVSNRNSDEDELFNEGRALFDLLFSKEAVTALREAKQLIISPDGPLWELPFGALPVTEEASTSEYMGLKTPVVYAQSLALYKHSRDAAAGSVKTGKTQAVVLGNPLFSVNPGTSDQSDRIRSEREYLYGASPPSQLPGATIEAQRIAGLYRTTPLVDKSATEAALRRVIEQADVVHLATHGKYDQRRVMSSGILLANGTESREVDNNDDGVLQAWEIYSQLKLKAELLVLSACESGRGENVQGEGIVGLTRALQYAGAHSVVASQWLVNDSSAQKLMITFHELLLQNKPKHQALQQAMRLVNSDPATKHPYYWASFILLGDTVNHSLGKVGKSQ
jgi:CHAT domain-containing protein